MFHAKFAAIIRRASITEFTHAMAVRVFSSVPFAGTDNTFVNQKAMDFVRLTRHTATSAALAV
jgi:hypothetical protein